ncbi:MAG: transporter substrate-binding domain-containing protein [Lachnospiraceae bacterium]|nr:transporter substrate-binding domain-containing protein [Lachnospiraceae bacterium]
MRIFKHAAQLTVLTLLLSLLFSVEASLRVYAKEEQKVVRVGWYDSSFCYMDRFGRRCGLDYEYQQKISAYTGWTYEYVEDSWSNLFQMLKDGEIDLLSDVSYRPEREEFMLFPDLPMGSEAYYIYVDSENREISANELESFNKKRIGVNRDSIQEGFLKDWAERNGISVEIIPLDVSESESINMVTRGEIDGYTTVYSVGAEEDIIPVSRVGSSDYFYAVNKNRPDLLAELNMALSGIQDEDPFFKQRISEDNNYETNTNIYLTPDQEDWLAEHGTIRVGYLDNCIPFCQADKETGELTGALKDYLAHSLNHLRNYDICFESVPFSSTREALDELNAGRLDCVFPVNLSSYDANEAGLRLTSPAMKTGMNSVMRASDQQALSRDSTLTFAVSGNDLNIDTFIKEQYPDAGRVFCDDGTACFEAVASGEADCIVISNYRMPALEERLTKYKLFSVPTGEHMQLSFAVKSEDRELYFIMNKTAITTGSGDMDSALASYMRSDQSVSFTRFLKDNWIMVILSLTAVFMVILILLLQKLKVERTANEQKRLLEEASEIVELKQTISSLLDNLPGMNSTKDAQTGVYLACNQAFAAYAKKTSPQEVIGHTDAELFDEETAKRLEQDDKMALSMDEPYIYFEDETDVEGNRRHVRNTRLKYTDDTGRLCVLGFSQDATTDTYHIRRDTATTKEAYEKARGTGIIYTHLAQALAQGYTNLYYIDLNTEGFIEYQTDIESGTLIEVQRGWHFFEACREKAKEIIYPEDREAVIKALDRKTLVAALEKNNTYMMTYRLIEEQNTMYVSMKVTRMQDDDRFIVVGVTDVDAEMRQRNASARVREEQIAYSRLSSLAGDFLCIYVVDPETGRYRELSAIQSFEKVTRPKEGLDFFGDSREHSRDAVYSEDQNLFFSVFTEENVMADVERHGIFTLRYRIMMGGRPRFVQLKAVMREEKEGRRLIVGLNDIDAQVRQEEDYAKHLAQAKIDANIDALTGVRNRHAYLEAEELLDAQVKKDPSSGFAIVILDVNDLKKVNDNEGHKAGDQYLRSACRIICNTFKHSPVFRVGGDEFAVIAQGDDYDALEELVGRMSDHNSNALENGGIVIACGMAMNENDPGVSQVFERADRAMYENKRDLKNRKAALMTEGDGAAQ